jgi:hypothetical protein
MRKFVCFLLISLLVGNTFLLEAAWADNMKYGKINIISEISGANIYIDGEIKGKDVVNLSQIPAGTHYVKVMDALSNVLFSDVITVEEGKVVTIVAKLTDHETKILDQGTHGQNTIAPQNTQSSGQDYGKGFALGKNEGYRKGEKDGNHQARINKSWAGWGLWIVFVLLVYAAK